MAQSIPKDYVRDSQDQVQKENVKPSKGNVDHTQ